MAGSDARTSVSRSRLQVNVREPEDEDEDADARPSIQSEERSESVQNACIRVRDLDNVEGVSP